MRLPIRHFLLLFAFTLASLSAPIPAAAAVEGDDIGWDEDEGEAEDEDFAEEEESGEDEAVADEAAADETGEEASDEEASGEIESGDDESGDVDASGDEAAASEENADVPDPEPAPPPPTESPSPALQQRSAADQEDRTVYKVVMNHEEQYSIWPADRENALGWRDAGKQGSKEECLAYIQEVWTDMRPLSLRKKMEEMERGKH